jgi:nucleotide-binding universal stress UspA family protein
MYRRILVPVDGSPTATSGLDEAVRMAAPTGAEIRLLHVVDAWTYSNGFETPAIYCEEVLPRMRREGERILAEARERVTSAGVAVSMVLAEKVAHDVADLVVAEAKEWRADLIVIGSHGRRGFDRFMMGSDAERIVRSAPVPVLVVRNACETVSGRSEPALQQGANC